MPNFGASYVARQRRSRHQKDHIIVEHYFKVEILFVTIDKQLQELNCRFNDQAMELLILSSALDPKDAYKAFNIDKRFNYAFGLHFGVKISKWYPKSLKVSKWFPFLLKRLTFALTVKSTLTPLEGVPRVSSSIF